MSELICIGHVIGLIRKKYRGARGAPGVKMIGFRISLSGRCSDGLSWTVSLSACPARKQPPGVSRLRVIEEKKEWYRKSQSD